METNEKVFIICMPIDIPNDFTIPDSELANCVTCATTVTMAPSSINYIKRCEEEGFGWEPLCLRCYGDQASPDDEIRPIQPDQISEILYFSRGGN